MIDRPLLAEFPDGRLHVQHGPIDLIITIDSPPDARAQAIQKLLRACDGLLAGLVADLPVLRAPAPNNTSGTTVTSARMIEVTNIVAKHAFITPMAAVAGAVADTICTAIWNNDMDRLIVNNGGDIAFRLAPGRSINVALADIELGGISGMVRIHEGDQICGIATSGRGGRSRTLGIADSVTVLASSAAAADAAATVIASAVDLPGSDKICRQRADLVDAESDLGERLIVVSVGEFTSDEESSAIVSGFQMAAGLRQAGALVAASLRLGGTRATLHRDAQFDRIEYRDPNEGPRPCLPESILNSR